MVAPVARRATPAQEQPMYPAKETLWRHPSHFDSDNEVSGDEDSRQAAYEEETASQHRSESRPRMVPSRSQSRLANGHFDDPYVLPALQIDSVLEESDTLDPQLDDDPASYDLVQPAHGQGEGYSLERRSQALFSREHLQVIFADPSILLNFTSFLSRHRPRSLPLLIHYLDTLKAIRAIHYANAVCSGLDPIEGLEFSKVKLEPFMSKELAARAIAAFDHMVREELPAYITHQYIQIVSASISSRITGMLAPHLREASEGLAEVFCLTDPSRPDNPIVFASEEFNKTTQYGMSYVLGRNCRFLQGPWTNPLSVRRLKDAIAAGRQHQEVFLNYRRDGSPFMNLLMIAPLCDSRGTIRYFIGAQVDVSGLVKDCADLPSLQRLVELQERGEEAPQQHLPNPEKKDELRELSEMFSQAELSTVRTYGGDMHRDIGDDRESIHTQAPRLLLRDPRTLTPPLEGLTSGLLTGCYQHYLLVRPYPSLRILFASPSQRIPGILQSPFLNKIGGSQRVRDELTAALAEGRGVTAKVRWVSSTRPDDPGRSKWIHCTPLVASTGQIGVWMVVLVDGERSKSYSRSLTGSSSSAGGRRAPPVPSMLPRDRSNTRNWERQGRPEAWDYQANGGGPNGGGNGNGNGNGNIVGGNRNAVVNGLNGDYLHEYHHSADTEVPSAEEWHQHRMRRGRNGSQGTGTPSQSSLRLD